MIRSSDLENIRGWPLSRGSESNNKKNLDGQMSDILLLKFPNSQLKSQQECNLIMTYK